MIFTCTSLLMKEVPQFLYYFSFVGFNGSCVGFVHPIAVPSHCNILLADWYTSCSLIIFFGILSCNYTDMSHSFAFFSPFICTVLWVLVSKKVVIVISSYKNSFTVLNGGSVQNKMKITTSAYLLFSLCCYILLKPWHILVIQEHFQDCTILKGNFTILPY